MTSTAAILDGIRVVELADLVFLPSAGAFLADFGAEVIKVEPPGVGDMNRIHHRFGGMPASEFPYIFHVDNRNKKSLVANLKTEVGQEVVRRLAATADVFLTNRRAAALEKFRLSWEELRAVNPRLVYVHGTGYGEKGPESHKPGYDAVCYWSRSGIESQIFPLEDWLGPLPWGSGDHPSGVAALGGIMLALYARERTGRGYKVPVSLLACGAWANASTIAARLCEAEFREKGPRESYHYNWICYLTRDRRVLKLCIPDEAKRWPTLCDALGRSDLAEDPRFAAYEQRVENMPELIAALDEAFAQRGLEYWTSHLESFDIPHTALADYDAIANDEQMAANDIIIDCDLPGFAGVRTVNTPIEIDEVEKRPPGPWPEHGEHTRELMLGLGYAESEIDSLAGAGAVGCLSESDETA